MADGRCGAARRKVAAGFKRVRILPELRAMRRAAVFDRPVGRPGQHDRDESTPGGRARPAQSCHEIYNLTDYLLAHGHMTLLTAWQRPCCYEHSSYGPALAAGAVLPDAEHKTLLGPGPVSSTAQLYAMKTA